MLGYQNTQVTLIEKLEAVINNKEEVKKVLDELADRLLQDMPEPDDKADAACAKILELHNNLYNVFNLYDFLKPISRARMSDIDDLKYFLKKSRYKYHFLHNHSDQFKSNHINLLIELCDGFEIDANSLNNEKDRESIRRKLLDEFKNGQYVKARYVALLIMAKYWPLNTEDLITLDAIDPNSAVFVSTGNQFDLRSLMENHQKRDVRYKANGLPFETAASKKLLTPWGTEFNCFDSDHIFRLAGLPTPFSNDDVLDHLFDFQHIRKIRSLSDIIGKNDEDCIISVERMVLLEKNKFTRLVHLIQANHHGTVNSFIIGLIKLIKKGMSIEHFANLPIETQENLTLPPIMNCVNNFRVVLEIECTLANQIHSSELSKYNNVMYAKGKPYYLYEGAVEFIRWLHDVSKQPLIFFCAGPEARHKEFIQNLLSKTFGENHGHDFQLYSEKHLIEAVKNDAIQPSFVTNSGFWGASKKDLNISMRHPHDLSGTVLIDDDQTYVIKGQEANLLKLYAQDACIDALDPNDGVRNNPDCFASLNRIFYAAGLLHTALENSQTKGRPITSELFDLQYEKTPEGFLAKYYDLFEKETFYKIGLSVLQKYNPDLKFLAEHHIEKHWAKSSASLKAKI